MKKLVYAIMKQQCLALLTVAHFFTANAVAQTHPEVKIDFNMNGRSAAEVQEPGYTPWVVTQPLIDSLTVNGIKFIIQKGPRGTQLTPTYFKAGVQEGTFNTRFTNDGLTVKDGDFALGASIYLTIKGLPEGTHSLVTYHNMVDNLAPSAVCPMNVFVDSVLKISKLVPTVRLYKTTECQTAELEIKAEAGKDVIIWLKADTTGTQAVKNVIINGLQLNGINAGKKSRSPIPSHREEHLDVPIGGSYILRWEGSPSTVTHDVYFGTDSLAVANADKTSPLYKGSKTLADTAFAATNLYTMPTYYWRVDEVGASNTYKGDVWMFRTRQLAFAGAEGYGRFARGGRGGKVVEVTNLNDNGPGSLREAIMNDIDPRTIVFAVSGIITLNSKIVIPQPYITIAGQTAPGKGICLSKSPFGVGSNDVIVRNMRLRLGAGPTADGMGIVSDHVIMDHCSISWTIDEAFSSRVAKNMTLQRTLISEALNVAGHDHYEEGHAHGYAAAVGGNVSSFHHNLIAHCTGRNPRLDGGVDGAGVYMGKLDIFNNVVYNWDVSAAYGEAMQANFFNNYYKKGPATKKSTILAADVNQRETNKGSESYYYGGNILANQNGTLMYNGNNPLEGRTHTIHGTMVVDWDIWVTKPFYPSYATIHTATDAYKSVLSDVGTNQPVLDDHDKRVITETLDGTYAYTGSISGIKGLIDHQDDQGGYENYPALTRAANWDSDHDGMPDWWENLKGFNPNSPAGDFSESNADPDMDGYTNLDYYLEWMASPHFSAADGAVIVDLKALSRGYKVSPTFTVTGAVNGTVSQVNGIATFTPAQKGLGSFSFTVTDGEGSTMTQTVNTLSGVNLNLLLPVKLVSFEAERSNTSNVKLTWQTVQETSNSHFVVERSFTGGNDFVRTGNNIPSKAVNGSGTTTLNYEATDANAFAGDTWYRLLQVDRDGKSTVSDVKVVKGSNAKGLQVWPVPNNGNFSVALTGINTGGLLSIYDAAGKLINTHQLTANGVKQVQLKAKGSYLLKVSDKANGKILFTKTVLVN